MGESGGRRQGLGSRCNAMERTSLIWKGTKWPPRSAETQQWVTCHTIRDRCMRISEQQSALDRRLTCSTAALCAPPASQKAEEKSLRAPLLRKTFGPRPTQEKYILESPPWWTILNRPPCQVGLELWNQDVSESGVATETAAGDSD